MLPVFLVSMPPALVVATLSTAPSLATLFAAAGATFALALALARTLHLALLRGELHRALLLDLLSLRHHRLLHRLHLRLGSVEQRVRTPLRLCAQLQEGRRRLQRRRPRHRQRRPRLPPVRSHRLGHPLLVLRRQHAVPGGADGGDAGAVDRLHVRLCQVRKHGSVQRLAEQPLGRGLQEEALPQLRQLLAELGSGAAKRLVERQCSHLLQVRLLRHGHHERGAVARREQICERLADPILVAGGLALDLQGGLEVLLRRDRLAVPLQRLGEVAEHPQERWEELAQMRATRGPLAVRGDLDVVGQPHHQAQLAKRHVIDEPERVVDEER
mmetsp:Transcript_29342/g.95770  ORF Transcript_29342/g.95770 Transcript_29342/m.95770 type:complete len:328 (-) Transcript_29342:395-1378(-)